MEFRESNRGRWVIALGVIMAVLAGGAAFFLINQAQQQAGQATAQRVPAVVAIQTIPARETIKASDVEVRMVPIDPTNANGVVADPAQAVGRIPAVSILQGQLITTNMLASTTEGGEFSILGPDESVTPESEAWRAVSLTVPDDSAVGGLLKPGQSVDVFVTAIVNVPADLVSNGRFYPDRSTKITYQDMVILARKDAFYVVRAPLAIAEEIAHLQATGNATFSLALRPDQDTRSIDARGLGETTNRIIQKYGLPVPEAYPIGRGPIQTPVPTASPPPPAPTEAPVASSPASPAP
jgi:Flp pilus assembly protein CpaB